MLKHLPEQLVPFEDSGFARHPEYPLVGDSVRVDCLYEGDGVPRLLWSVDGVPRPALDARRLDERHWRFELGQFHHVARVQYSIHAGAQQLGPFHFELGRWQRFEHPQRLISNAQGLHAIFEGGLSLSFALADQLHISSHRRPPEGESIQEGSISLQAGWSLQLGGDCLWQLKRLNERKIEGIALAARLLPDGSYSHLRLEARLHTRHIWGTGERFDQVDQQGLGSSGRVVEKFTQQGEHSYIPMPFFMTEAGFGWYRQGAIPSEMRFGEVFTLTQEVQGEETYTQDTILLGQPKATLHQYIALTGQPALPPDWAFGLWISANGWSSERDVDEQLAAMRRHDYPASAMVLEAWSDERTFYQWNPDGSWPDPAAMIGRIQQAGMQLVLWQIPVIKHEWSEDPGAQLLADEAEAIGKGYVIRNADGSPYRITDKWFHWSLLPDFTNPAACDWWFGKRQHLLDLGVAGFKTDGGEFLFDKRARLHNGSTGLSGHNLYPAQYIGAYQDWMRRSGLHPLTFSRAGYAGAQTQPLHWAGDQLSTFDELRAQLTAGISAGLSGLLFWGFDIAGFAGEIPSAELYLRATALGCFCPVMQWHAEPRSGQFYGTHAPGFNNDRSPWNLADQLNAPWLIEASARYARLRVRLMPYLLAEARHCVAAHRPMMAHLCLDWPEDEAARAADDQYMLGRRLLVAPILREGERQRSVYLPAGRWRHWFTDELLTGPQRITAYSDLDSIPVYELLPDEEVNPCT